MGRQGGEPIISLKEKIGLRRVMMRKGGFFTAVIIAKLVSGRDVQRKRLKVGKLLGNDASRILHLPFKLSLLSFVSE
jgi:hypothetical protein